MDSHDVLLDGFGRVRDDVHGAVEGLDESALTFRAGPDANTIAMPLFGCAPECH